jgi:hypothetical protein
MRTTNINITLDPAKEGKWYAQEKVNKQGDTTVTFFQRDGKQTFLQKFKDFKNGVHSGTELATKYSKELGLPKDAFSNPKNKHTKESISNDQLNQIFGLTCLVFSSQHHLETLTPLVNSFPHSDMNSSGVL